MYLVLVKKKTGFEAKSERHVFYCGFVAKVAQTIKAPMVWRMPISMPSTGILAARPPPAYEPPGSEQYTSNLGLTGIQAAWPPPVVFKPGFLQTYFFHGLKKKLFLFTGFFK